MTHASHGPASTEPTVIDEAAMTALLRTAGPHGFGPLFFLGQLAAFVRERCPDPAEHLPRVDLRLADGEVVAICHVIAVGPRWVAVAARDRDVGEHGMTMRTELIPYELIARVTISGASSRGHGIGFEQVHPPAVVETQRTPEEILLAAAGQTAAT